MGDIGAAAQAGASIASAGIQAASAKHAADMQADAARNALDFSKQQFNTQQANIQPYLGAGKQGLGALSTGLGLDNGSATAPGSLNQSFSYNPTDFNPDSIVRNPDFAAPQTTTAQFDPASVNITQDPSYQFRYDQGLQALQRNQAATGITGGAAAKALTDYGQGAASQEYANAYQRALAASQQNQGINQQNYNQAANTYGLDSSNHQQWIANAANANQMNNANALNQYNAQTGQQTNQFNRLAAIAGLGQAGNTQLGNASNAAQQNVMAANGAIGNAAAAGAVGMGNAFSNMATSVGQYFGNKYGS